MVTVPVTTIASVRTNITKLLLPSPKAVDNPIMKYVRGHVPVPPA
jgi:hypothetical protein